jgi:hypothetical protein
LIANGDERLTKVPADLDLEPYRDEHDNDLVQRMLSSMWALRRSGAHTFFLPLHKARKLVARGQGTQGVKAKDVDRAVPRWASRT